MSSEPALAAAPTAFVGARRPPRVKAGAVIGALIVGFWLLIAFFGPLVSPHDVGEVVDTDLYGEISRAFPLGTDYLGRDVLSRIIFGARYTIGVAVAATAIAIFAGGALGMLAAVSGRWIDALLSRSFDALISIPSLMFGLVAIAALGSSVPVLVGTTAIIYTPGAFRIWRSLAVNVNAMDYVVVARARGEGKAYLIREEILPNIIGPVLTDFGLRFVFAVLLLSALSFLGLGIQPPYADWGSLVRENIIGLSQGAPAVVMPAAAIATLTIGVNLIVDNLPGRRLALESR
ncbi:peptide/nickel transport system permease protein [Rhizobiales bacterium GAS113]|nr:peptide/nickel transport system permease protein [Rhizobiales bacterium GAS113]